MTDLQIQQLILQEVRELRASLDDYRQESVQRLTSLETHLHSIVGNGQPGRLTIVENKVSDLQHWRHTTTGIYIGVSTLVSAVVAFVYHLFK
jgi:hypothetical protein